MIIMHEREHIDAYVIDRSLDQHNILINVITAEWSEITFV